MSGYSTMAVQWLPKPLTRVRSPLAALVILTLILAGCGLGAKRYLDKEEGFSISFPASWKAQRGVKGARVVIVSPREGASDKFRENVTVFANELPPDWTLEEAFTRSIDLAKTVQPHFKEQERGLVSIGGREAMWIIFSSKVGKLKAQYMLHFFINDNRSYLVSCTSTPDEFPEYRRTFEKIVQSFRSKRRR